MKKFGLQIGGLAALLLVLGEHAAWAADDELSTQLAKGLYCSVHSLLEGDIGLILGLAMMFLGIWSMVQGAKIWATLPFIIIGALMTALPSLVESSLEGLGNLLQQSGISSQGFNAPKCSSDSGMTGTDSHPGKVEDDLYMGASSQSSSFFPADYKR